MDESLKIGQLVFTKDIHDSQRYYCAEIVEIQEEKCKLFCVDWIDKKDIFTTAPIGCGYANTTYFYQVFLDNRMSFVIPQ